MQCRHHPERSAANTCNQCGSWLCDECTVDIQGRLFCRGCLTQLSSHHTDAVPPPVVGSPASAAGLRFSWGLLFMFSCFFPPGTNYMYMGLIKRGLATMCGFFLLIYMTAVAPGRLTIMFALAIPVTMLACIFDGFSIRRRLNAGEIVPDGVGDIVGKVLNNKFVVLTILAILFFAFAGSALGFAINLISSIVPFLIIGFALYVIFKQ